MDRRTKFILLIAGAIVLFGLVVWFIVVPTLAPLFPAKPPPSAGQPPGLPGELKPPETTPGTQARAPGAPSAPGGAVVAFEPAPSLSGEEQRKLELARRAGALSERVESGSSANGFTNLDDAALDASPALTQKFRQMKTDLQKQHPAAGPLYLTIARRLLEKPEDAGLAGPTFKVTVQLQIQTQNAVTASTLYREATVTFTKSGEKWIASGYEAKAFSP